MAKQVLINGNPYTLNQAGDVPPWGEQQSELIEALVNVANTVVGTGDILTTSFTINNNVTSATPVTGMQFDPATIRSAIIEYSIYRSTTTEEVSECGTMTITYLSQAARWDVARYSVGDSGIVFTFDSSGQAQYTSSEMLGTGHSGLLKYRARAFTQT